MGYTQQIGQYVQTIKATQREFDEGAFPRRAEYTIDVYKRLFKEVIELLGIVAENPDLFALEFSPDEMEAIAGLARELADNSDQNTLSSYLNANRPLISRMRAVFGEKGASQYESEVEELQGSIRAKLRELQEGVHANQQYVQKNLEGIKGQYDGAVDMLNNIKMVSKLFEERRSLIEELFSKIENNQKNAQELEVKNNKFLQEMQEDEIAYKEKRNEIIKAAESMLGLANAAEMADAFNQRIDKEKEKGRWPWISGAIFFMTLTMAVAIWLYANQGEEITLTGTLARMSITAIPLLGAWFCGSRYLKLERTLEDYQYKKALAQSMPAFMKQLGKDTEEHRTDEYRAYLFMVFQQMLQDPLRKKHDVPSPLKDLFDKVIKKLSTNTTSESSKETKSENQKDST